MAGRRPADNLFLLNGIEYTGSSQLAVTPGGVSGELLGIDAVREFNVLTDTYGAEYGKRAGAQVSVVTQSGTNALHGSLFEFLRNSALDARNFFDQTSFVPPFRQNQFGGALGGPLKKNQLFLFGNYEGFRQALTLSSVSVVPDAQARQGLLPERVRRLHAGGQSESGDAAVHVVLAAGQRSGAAGERPAERHGALLQQSASRSIREDFGTCAPDYTIRDRDSLSGVLHHRRRQQPDSRWPIRCSAPTPRCASRWPACRRRTSSRRDVLNTFACRILARGFQSRFGAAGASFRPDLSFVTGEGPGRHRRRRRRHHHRAAAASPRPVRTTPPASGIAAISSPTPTTCRSAKGIHQISAGVWFQRVQDNEDTASRQLGQATFASLTTFLQGTVSTFQVVPDRQRTRLAKPVRRLVCRRTPSSCGRNLTLQRRHPARIHHRLERSRRAAPPTTSPMPTACC